MLELKPGFLPTGFLFFPRNPVFCQPGFFKRDRSKNYERALLWMRH
jgi:hypothetical protein